MSPVLLFAGLFERAVALDKSWEKGYFSYAVYLDQLMRDARQRQTALTASSRTSAKPMDRLGGRSRQAWFPQMLSHTILQSESFWIWMVSVKASWAVARYSAFCMATD